MRSEQLLSLRSEIPVDSERNPLELEQFQNSCIRPILKYQNNALLVYFRAQIQDEEIPKSIMKREALVKLRLQKDMNLRNLLVGMVLGLMTVEELSFYQLNKSELSRRIVTMLIQRISGQL
jgi:5,10-methylenetetrahydrofolate reductase